MKLTNKRIVGAVIALLFVVSITQSGAITDLAKRSTSVNQIAQVPGATSSIMRPSTRTYGVADNATGQTGIYFPVKKVVTVTACGAGGGGGGGGRGWEDGSDDGAGGGGGGGGGNGYCETRTLKLSAGDTLRWLVGTGGTGGNRGRLYEKFDPCCTVYEDSSATMGGVGGTTFVSVNGVDVMQLSGGWSGQPGGNASSWGGFGFGGLGGGNFTSPGDMNASWHKGQNGSFEPVGSYAYGYCHTAGIGGNGGKGQTNLSNTGGTGGAGGQCVQTVADYQNNSYIIYYFGFPGLVGAPSFGGGGGGGGVGRWRDIGQHEIEQAGGNGAPGGNGYVIISY